MNETEPSSLEFTPSSLAFTGFSGFLVFIYGVSMIVTFPLYVYAHRINKKTDKLAYFYPITLHFYTVICSMQFYMYATIFLCFVTWILLELSQAVSVFLLSFCLGYLISVAVTSVQNVLLFVLALRRFLILLLPNFKKTISIDPKTFSRVLKLLYTFYIVIQVFTKVIKVFCGTNSLIDFGIVRNQTTNHDDLTDEQAIELRNNYDNCSSSVDNVYMRLYLAGDILVMLAGALYGFMFIKIRRWSKMTGDQLNRPEKYIFYQTLLIVLTKLMAVTMILVSVVQSEYTDDAAFTIFVMSDITTTPLVIQCSYLLCNRANIDAIFAIQFKKLRTWLVLICGADPGKRPRPRKLVAAKYIAAKKTMKELMTSVAKKTVTRQNEVVVVEPVVIAVQPGYLNRRRQTIH